MTEPNNGVIVGDVRIVVLDLSSQGGWRALFRDALWIPVRKGPAEVRIYPMDDDAPIATATFATHHTAERARTLLAGLAGPDDVDWRGELARLAGVLT